ANLANLAKAPATPDSVKMDVRRLSNTSFLYWQKPRTGKVKGYYVLVRETTSAFWQKKVFTTETEMRLPYSKDNYFFGVQAVNETGNESLPVVPLPGR
ncbi:MAG: fibronectin type III domain-containing protein, partial [Ferruginibacter sp.]